MKKLLWGAAIVNWCVGAAVYWMVVSALKRENGFDQDTLILVVGTAMLTAVVGLQPSYIAKRPYNWLLLPAISIATVWLIWPVGNWVAEHPSIKWQAAFTIIPAFVPAAVSIVVVGGPLLLLLSFLKVTHGRSRSSVGHPQARPSR